MARSFEDYDRPNSRTDCPRCGGPEKHGAVTVRLLEFKDGNSSRFDQVESRQVSMCENCTVEVYEMLKGVINDETRGGSRPQRGTGTRSNGAAKATTTARRRRRTRASR